MVRHSTLPGFVATLALTGAALTAFPWTGEARADAGVRNDAGECHFVADTARQALDDGRYEEARNGFSEAVGWTDRTCRVPIDNNYLWDNVRGHAEASMRLGDHARAADDIARLLRSRSARSKLGENDFEWMMEAVQTAIDEDTDRAAYYGARAALREALAFRHRMNGDRTQADIVILEALADRDFQVARAASDPERAAALADRHLLHRSLGDRAAAFADIEAAILADPQADYHWRRALMLKDRGDTSALNDALADLDAALELAPERHWYHRLQAEIHRMMDDAGSAIDSLTAALEVVPAGSVRNELLEERAGLLRRSDRLADAAADYATLLERRPNHAGWRAQRLLLLTQQGLEQEAAEERRAIAALDRSILRSQDFVCRMSEADDRRRTASGETLDPDDMQRAWNQGQILVLVPLRHVVGNPDDQTARAWTAMSDFVAGSRTAGKAEPAALAEIPAFTGSKSDQLRQALRFINDQIPVVRSAAQIRDGDQAAALMTVSAFGHLAEALNRMGLPNLNTRFGENLARYGPSSGLPCDLWIQAMQATLSGDDRQSVVSAWSHAKDAFRAFTDP